MKNNLVSAYIHAAYKGVLVSEVCKAYDAVSPGIGDRLVALVDRELAFQQKKNPTGSDEEIMDATSEVFRRDRQRVFGRV